MATLCCGGANDGISPLLLFSILVLLTPKETTNSALPLLNVQSNPGQLQPGFLFARLLGELTDSKNELVQCPNFRSAAHPHQHHSAALSVENHGRTVHRRLVSDEHKNSPITPKPLLTSTAAAALPAGIFEGCEPGTKSGQKLAGASSDTLARLDNVKLANVVRHRCIGKDLVRCLQTTRATIVVMNTYSVELKSDLDTVCCKLQRCHADNDQQQGKHPNDNFATCQQMCFQQKQKPGNNTHHHTALLSMLSSTSCGNLQYGGIPCTHLNLLALNLLAGPGSAKEWSGAINLLSNCYPTYDTDIMWLFQDMVGNMSMNNVKMLRTLLNATLVSQLAEQSLNQSAAWSRMSSVPNGDVTSQAIEVWHLTPRSIAGIVIVVVLISASLSLGFYAIYQKVKFHLFPDNTVHYSQVLMQDDFSEEEEEFDENDVYYR